MRPGKGRRVGKRGVTSPPSFPGSLERSEAEWKAIRDPAQGVAAKKVCNGVTDGSATGRYRPRFSNTSFATGIAENTFGHPT
jgi:hypothetical protein